MKTTEWFQASVKPIHEGLYEVERPSMAHTPWQNCMMIWNGFQWVYQDGSYSDFGKPWEHGSKWRGLMEPAKCQD